ncbi:ribbon-helix-helix domain-containing protein [Rhizobium laguerreae]|uniref:ribbon-helix-helix domain-containing protein n=1 Tax=Rhizobium laguerreae TaxID=1076926 RepID=UPI001C8FBC7F|nr:ribbon-helix-helix domain-containing protein [Rhizobium laguerreae]MBY3199969.1 hypothetical protein [Rhizobium laguerreae]
MAAIGISFSEDDLAKIDREVIRRKRIDASTNRSSVVRLAVREFFQINQPATPAIRVRTRSNTHEQN